VSRASKPVPTGAHRPRPADANLRWRISGSSTASARSRPCGGIVATFAASGIFVTTCRRRALTGIDPEQTFLVVRPFQSPVEAA
jgi:hypothetical protein